MDEDEADMVQEVLDQLIPTLRRKTEISGRDFLLDKMKEYFDGKQIQLLGHNLSGLASEGRLEEAHQELAKFRSVERVSDDEASLFEDQEQTHDAFEHAEKDLLYLPGALSGFFRGLLVEQGLVGLMGREKVGKTWWMLWIALMAWKARMDVAYFGAGDMMLRQIIKRFCIMSAKRSDKERYCGTFTIPILDCVHNQTGTCPVAHLRDNDIDLYAPDSKEEMPTWEDADREYRPCTACMGHPRQCRNFEPGSWFKEMTIPSPLTWGEVVTVGRKLQARTRGRKLRIKCYPNDTLTVSRIEAQLDIWRDMLDFVPKIIMVDYPDIMAPESADRSKQPRDQENAKWKGLRRLSQDRNCLVCAVTQVKAMSYQNKSLTISDFADDKRKYAHVTGMIAINQTPEERQRGQWRLGHLVLREEDFDVTKFVTVLGSLRIGCPHLASYF